MQVRGRGEGPVALGEAPDGAVVGDTHPMASGALLLAVPPLDQEHPALSGADPGLWGGGPATADGAANTFNNIERVYSRAIAFSNRRCSVPLESVLPTSQVCTVSSSIRTAFI